MFELLVDKKKRKGKIIWVFSRERVIIVQVAGYKIYERKF